MQRNWVIVLLFVLLGHPIAECTSAQNLHNLLRHPHYADSHQHSSQHSQHTTFHPLQRRPASSSAPHHFAGTTSKLRSPSEAPTLPTGLWSRVGSKDHYKMSGYSIKTTSAAKSLPIVDPRIPQELSDVREANDHFVRMRSSAYCHWPRAQVVCVRDLYPDKEFLPRCTILHRCTESSGCCEEEELQCAPKAMQEVVLHFYVLGGDHLSSDVEKLLFVNHTECECKPRPPPVLTTAPPLNSTTSIPTTTIAEHHHSHKDQHNPKCRICPSPFCVRELEGGICSCDCFDRHRPCIRVKRGREPLADIERRCILAGKCNIPDCEYGPYDSEKGRCPKKQDQQNGEDRRRPLPNHKNPNHRWIYFERD